MHRVIRDRRRHWLPPLTDRSRQQPRPVLCDVLHHNRDVHRHRNYTHMVYVHPPSSLRHESPSLIHQPLAVTYNLGSETKRAAGMPIYMAIGQCGSILGSHLFPATEGPRYIKGFAVSCALEFLAAICAFVLTVRVLISSCAHSTGHLHSQISLFRSFMHDDRFPIG